jgi:phage terminase small subunit
MSITPRQERFCEEYVVDLNATQAAIRAGYAESGAAVEASRFLRNPNIRDYIEELQTGRRRVREIRADRILNTLETIAYGDVSVFYGEDGELLPRSEWPEGAHLLVAGIEFQTVEKGEGMVTHIAKIKLVDRLKALNMLAQHKALLTQKIEITADDDLVDRIARARSRLNGDSA